MAENDDKSQSLTPENLEVILRILDRQEILQTVRFGLFDADISNIVEQVRKIIPGFEPGIPRQLVMYNMPCEQLIRTYTHQYQDAEFEKLTEEFSAGLKFPIEQILWEQPDYMEAVLDLTKAPATLNVTIRDKEFPYTSQLNEATRKMPIERTVTKIY